MGDNAIRKHQFLDITIVSHESRKELKGTISFLVSTESTTDCLKKRPFAYCDVIIKKDRIQQQPIQQQPIQVYQQPIQQQIQQPIQVHQQPIQLIQQQPIQQQPIQQQIQQPVQVHQQPIQPIQQQQPIQFYQQPLQQHLFPQQPIQVYQQPIQQPIQQLEDPPQLKKRKAKEQLTQIAKKCKQQQPFQPIAQQQPTPSYTGKNQCEHIFRKGPKKGTRCNNPVGRNLHYCSTCKRRHKNEQPQQVQPPQQSDPPQQVQPPQQSETNNDKIDWTEIDHDEFDYPEYCLKLENSMVDDWNDRLTKDPFTVTPPYDCSQQNEEPTIFYSNRRKLYKRYYCCQNKQHLPKGKTECKNELYTIGQQS